MTEPTPPEKPLAVGEALGSLTKSPFHLSMLAAGLAFLSLVLPFLGIKVNVGFLSNAGSLNGMDAAGWVAWVTFALFALAAASRKVAGLYPYKNLLEIGAIAGAVCMIVWAWFFNPVAEQMSRAGEMFGRIGGPDRAAGNLFSQYPHIGMVAVLAAAGALIIARRKDQTSA